MTGPPRIPSASGLPFQWAGETLFLLRERALWWQRTQTLFIADPHFGKASAFRFAGIPVPETTHHDDLDRLAGIVRQTAAKRLVILGDFLHARTGRSTATLGALADWRAQHAELEMVLVMGNHDRQAGPPPPEWQIQCVTAPWTASPFQCCHEPPENPSGFALAGHIHPACVLYERIGSTFHTPCFFFTSQTAILPAFGNFTGTHTVNPRRGDAVFLIGDNEVIEYGTKAKNGKSSDR
jgi:DNA ligase-associated metallophosphoesterase